MKFYASYGFEEFVVALGYKAEVVKNFFLHFADLESDQIKYCVRKRAAHPDRIKAQQEFVRRMRSSALRTKEPFALLHRGL